MFLHQPDVNSCGNRAHQHNGEETIRPEELAKVEESPHADIFTGNNRSGIGQCFYGTFCQPGLQRHGEVLRQAHNEGAQGDDSCRHRFNLVLHRELIAKRE